MKANVYYLLLRRLKAKEDPPLLYSPLSKQNLRWEKIARNKTVWVTNRHDTQREQYENNIVMTGALGECDSVTRHVTARCNDPPCREHTQVLS